MSSSHPFKLRVWDVERSIYLEDEVMWSVAGVPADMMPGQPPFIPFMMVALKSPATKYVVEQFTRLVDKTGRDIYEGDLVQYEHDGLSPRKGAVTWGEYDDDEYVAHLECWMLDNRPLSCMIRYAGKGHGCLSMVHPNTLQVIGNIHENPTLLNA